MIIALALNGIMFVAFYFLLLRPGSKYVPSSDYIDTKLFRFQQLLLVFLLLNFLMIYFQPRLFTKWNSSVSATIMLKFPLASLRKGDYVVARTPHKHLRFRNRQLTPRVLCLPGEFLSLDDGTFHCNGVLLNTINDQLTSSTPFTVFEWKAGPIPKGYAFVGTPHADGIDSRYLGLIPTDNLVRVESLL